MAVVTLVNQLKSHLHVASINKVVAPAGRLHLDSSMFESNAELKGCVAKGMFVVEKPAPATPVAPEAAKDGGEKSTVRTESGPQQVELFKMPEAPQAKAAAEKKAENSGPPKDEKSTVWTPDGPAFKTPFKMPVAAQVKAAVTKGETINGVEVLDLSGAVKSEKIDGIEIETPEEEPLGPQFIEAK